MPKMKANCGGGSNATSTPLRKSSEDHSSLPNNFTPEHLEKDIEGSLFFRRLKETAREEPGSLTVAQKDFIQMWHDQADGVYTLRQVFVQTAFDHVRSLGFAWSLYKDIWENLGRLLSMASSSRHALPNLHRTTSPLDSKPLTVNTDIAVASGPSVSIASGCADEDTATDDDAATYMHSEEPVVVHAPWAQYDMDEADYYYASIHGLHATPRETLNVHTFRSEFHSLGHSLYRNPVLRGYGTSNMCYSPKLGDAVPKLGSDVITPAPPPKDIVTPSAPKLGDNPRKVRTYNTYDYNIPDSQ